jgi:hypothetical protein
LAGEIFVFGEDLTQSHFVRHKSHMTLPDIEPGEKYYFSENKLVNVKETAN